MKRIILNEVFDFGKLIDEIVSVMKSGGVVLLPSDTCYGLSAKVDKSTKKKICDIKDMPLDKPISLSVADKSMFRELSDLDEVGEEILQIYLPGPLTLVVEPAEGKEFVGLRLPDHELMRSVSEKLGGPIFTTSANKHGQEAPYAVSYVEEQLDDKFDNIDLVIDAGVLDFRKPSTVVKVFENQLDFLREGDESEGLRMNYSVRVDR